MGDLSSPRELYSIIMELVSVGPEHLLQSIFVDKPQTNFSLVIDVTIAELLKLLKMALQRLSTKRYNFLKNAFPTILQITSVFVKIPSQSALNDEEQIKILNMEKELSERRYQFFAQALADLALSLSKGFSTMVIVRL
jgi:hypothetical protein